MKIVLAVLFLGLVHLGLPAQVDSLFRRVNTGQEERLLHIFSDQRDSVYAAFDLAVQALFGSAESCGALPDTSLHYFWADGLADITDGQTLAYGFMNNIVICTKGNLKIYSWDDLGGGSHHTYGNILQYMGENGVCVAIPLDTSENSDEVGYFRIERIPSGERELYLLFGYGTYGGGEQHYTLSMYEVKAGRVEECRACFPEGGAIRIACHRGQDIGLRYDAGSQVISYRAYEMEDGDYTNERKEVSLRFREGKWGAL
jgi:hypothetical protein